MYPNCLLGECCILNCERSCPDTHMCTHYPCSGLVPLHNACSYGHYEVAELLVKYNANVNAVDLWKFTPLHEAASKGKYEICKLLLKVHVVLISAVYCSLQ